MSFLLPDAGLLFWMLVVFGIVFFILARYGFPAIVAMLDERKRLIDESVQSAKEANERLVAINAESEAILKSARDEQARLLREATAMREELIKEARERAGKEGEKMLAETRRVIEMEKEEAVRDMGTYQSGVNLTDNEVNEIAAFLNTLTGEYEGKPLTNVNKQ